jgi:hypothetical protein
MEGMARRWKRVVGLATAAVLIGGAAGGTAWATGRTRDLRGRLAEARAGAGAELVNRIAVTSELDATRGRLRDTGEELTRELSKIEELGAGVEATLASLSAGREAVADQADVVGAQADALAIMQTCLEGVERALDAAQQDQFDAAVLNLASVEEPCRKALSRSPASSGYALVDANFPDPFVVADDGEYFAYATNAVGGSVQMARGPSLGELELVGPALDNLPSWGAPNRTWAPAVLHRDGYWVMYYSLEERHSRGTCISKAIAFSPAGPFVDNSASPFLCQSGGSIDPSPFVDADGTPWLIWKAEQFFAGGTRAIYSQQMGDDGLSLVGPATRLITSGQGWETGVVEGPSMVRSGDRYVLLYSGANWNSAGYAVGYAECDGPAGPCTKPTGRPVYRGGDGLSGAGGEEPFVDLEGHLRMVFHAWAGAEIGYPNLRRAYLADLDVSGPAPRVTRVRIGG